MFIFYERLEKMGLPDSYGNRIEVRLQSSDLNELRDRAVKSNMTANRYLAMLLQTHIQKVPVVTTKQIEALYQSNAQAVKDAAREFAKEQFKGHQYVFVLHTDESHPHVHFAVSMRDELGKRMNPRKNDLFHWRVLFAEKMREQSVDCAATKRQHRGKVQKGEHSILRNMQKRGVVSEIQKSQVEELITAIKENKRPLHPFLKEHLATKRMIGEEYRFLVKELYKEGLITEARTINKLFFKVMRSDNKTKIQMIFDDAVGYVQNLDIDNE